MDTDKYYKYISSLKFGEVIQCETIHCEECGTKLNKFITSSNPIYIKKGKRVCYLHR